MLGNKQSKAVSHASHRLLLVALVVAGAFCGCATEKKVIESKPRDRAVAYTKSRVSDGCRRAVEHQVSRSGFALVIEAPDVLAPDIIDYLDSLYRRIHGTPGVLSVRGISDEEVLSGSDLGVSFEPFVSGPKMKDRASRHERYQFFADLIDPVMLSADLSATSLVVKLQPTSKPDTRAHIRRRLLDMAFAAPKGIKTSLVEYPVAAADSLIWHTEMALRALETLNEKLGGAGVLEIGVRCRSDDCLLEPDNLRIIDRLEDQIRTLERVKATRSLIGVLKHAMRAITGKEALPESSQAALQLMAVMGLSSGIKLLVDPKYKEGVVRVYFRSGASGNYCELGRRLKKLAREACTDSIRFMVKKPGRRGF